MSWPLIVTAAAVLVVLVAIFVLAPKLGRHTQHGHRKDVSLAVTNQSSISHARDSKFYYKFTMNEGIPFIRIHLQSQPSQPFLCVLDSGSADLNVASPECGYCDGAHGAYVSNVKGMRTTLAYGTQTDTVIKKQDGLYLTSDTSATGAVSDIDVHVTVARTKDSSNFNVFGISQVGFMRNLLNNRALLISFHWHSMGGFVTSITADQASVYRDCALAHAPLVRLPSLPFYIIRLTAIKIGGISVPSPRYCIIDTGSNVISVPPQTFDALVPHIRESAPLEVIFGTAGPAAKKENVETDSNDGKIVVPHVNYTFFSQLMIDDDVPDFGVGSMMVLGCNGMMNHSFIFERNHLSVVRSNANVCEGVHRV